MDRDVSLFVGDLAGRLRKNGTPQDRSCSDRDFAANIAIPFSTPEEFFLDEEPASWRRQFDPTTYINRSIGAQPQLTLLDQPSPEIVLFCGSPGAGKSTFFQQAFAPSGYRRINQDTLKTRENCIKAARAILAESLSVVIDNTNANIETRRHWVDLARSHGVPIRCIHFTAPIELAKHNAAVRSGGGPLMNPEQRTALPDIAFVDYVKRFQAPDLNEGFKEVVKVDFTVGSSAQLVPVAPCIPLGALINHRRQFSGSEAQLALWNQHY